ncbi:MAG: BON domain-containing protein [Cyanobacteria bacterium]|nr:BON domain-containing protein [Cyanobacteriota bacterium]
MRTLAFGAALLLFLQSSGTLAMAEEPKADNTAQNRGATEKDAVTAEKQGNSDVEVKVLANIRKSVMDDEGLSMNAKNAKILYSAKKGIVTLRGPVDSQAEKTRVGELAKGCSGVTRVKNELTVAAKKK